MLHKPLLHWINDGLMAIFFLFAGLEIKREFLVGNLASRKLAALPPKLRSPGNGWSVHSYLSTASGNATAIRGWAIPAATDIAFALGFLALRR